MSRYRTLGRFVTLAAIWGLSFVATRGAVRDVPPVLLAALRFDVAGALILGYAFATTERWRPRTREDWTAVALGGTFFIAVHHALLFAGQQYVTSAVAGVVVSLDPVLAAAFARLLLPDERLSPTGALGFAFGVLGVAIVANPDSSRLLTADVRGVALVFLAAAAFALGAVLAARFRTDLPARSMQAWMMLFGAALLHLATLASPAESFAAIRWTTDALVGFGYLAVVAGGVGYLLYFELLDRLGPVEINLVGYVAPVFAALGGWLFLDERLAETTVLGFCCIVVGFVLIKRAAVREELSGVRRRVSREFD